jgi:polyferredoxin
MPAWRRPLQIGLLVLVVATALGLRAAGVPSSVAVFPAAAFGLVGVALMAVWSRRSGNMTHCSAYCPIGVLSTVLGRISPFRIRISAGCSECGACSLPCRYDALSKSDIEKRRPGSSCTLCGDCISRCRDARLGYRFLWLSPAAARTLFIVLVVAGHASFLGVARI